jgi:hypothetical protein
MGSAIISLGGTAVGKVLRREVRRQALAGEGASGGSG